MKRPRLGAQNLWPLAPVWRGAAAALALAPFMLPASLTGQSLLSAEGLGVIVEPLDARTRALGGSGLGLDGPYLLQRDPAASARLGVPTATVTFQSTTTTLTGGASAGHSRFPAIGASYPYRANVFSIQSGSFLDQEWRAELQHTLNLNGEPVDVTDTFTSSGSIGRVSLGWARPISESLSVGVTFGSYVGTTDRVFTRSLDPADVGSDVEVFETGGLLRASGIVAGAGVSWSPVQIVHVSASVHWSDELTLSPRQEDAGEKGVYRIPMQLFAGGTVTLAPQLALHLGLGYADWTDTGSDLAEGKPLTSAWNYGAGLEWSALSFLGRTMPARVGFKSRDLPFPSGGAAASEMTFSGGMGLNLVEAELLPLARLEFAVERGSREAGSLSEDFWRIAVSARVASG